MVSSKLVNIIVEISVEHVLATNPVTKESDNRGFYHHQNLDRARSDRLYWTPSRTQPAFGLCAHDDESASGKAFEKIVSLLLGPRERNVIGLLLDLAGRLWTR